MSQVQVACSCKLQEIGAMRQSEVKGDRMMEPLVMISEAAKIIDRSPSMVRWYENEGRLTAMRTSGGVRLFKKRDVEKLAEELRDKKRDAVSDTGTESAR